MPLFAKDPYTGKWGLGTTLENKQKIMPLLEKLLLSGNISPLEFNQSMQTGVLPTQRPTGNAMDISVTPTEPPPLSPSIDSYPTVGKPAIFRTPEMEKIRIKPQTIASWTYDANGRPTFVTPGLPSNSSTPTTPTTPTTNQIPPDQPQYFDKKGFVPPFKKSSDEVKQTKASMIADGIMKGITPPDLSGFGFSGIAPLVVAELENRGFDYKQAKLDWEAVKTHTKTMNSNQMVSLQTAFNTAEGDLSPMRELNEEFKRTKFNPVNKLIFKTELSGISLNPDTIKDMSEDQVRVATKYVTQLNLMRDTLAVAFMRGGVPTETAFKLTESILNPAYGSGQLDAALDQIQINLNIRRNATTTPYTQPTANMGKSATKKSGVKPVQKQSTADDILKKYGIR